MTVLFVSAVCPKINPDTTLLIISWQKMYLIELIIKKLTQKKERPFYNPIEIDVEKIGDIEYENCEHVFMPIDSTNELLSCAKCGILVKRSELKNKNFFLR